MRETKFVCGACGQVSKQAHISRHHASWVAHEDCGYETFFENFIPGGRVQDPEPKLVRPIGAGSEEDADVVTFNEFQRLLKADKVAVPYGSELKPSDSTEQDDVADAQKKIDETVTLDAKPSDGETESDDDLPESTDGDAKREEAIEFVVSRGYSKRAAKNIVKQHGTEKILADKAKEAAEKAQAAR